MKRFDLMHQINTRGTFVVSKWAIPHLAKAENPHILMLSPPLDMKEKWFAPHTAYTMAKFGMSLVVLGLAGELRSRHRGQRAVAAHRHRHRGGAEPARRRRHDARLAQAGDHGGRGLRDVLQAGARIDRPLSHRRYFPRRKRRDRFRAISRRSDAKTGAGFFRARESCRRRGQHRGGVPREEPASGEPAICAERIDEAIHFRLRGTDWIALRGRSQ